MKSWKLPSGGQSRSIPDRQKLLQVAVVFTPTSRAEVTGKDGKPEPIETIVEIMREAAASAQRTESVDKPESIER